MTETDRTTTAGEAQNASPEPTTQPREWIKPEIVTLDMNTAQAS